MLTNRPIQISDAEVISQFPNSEIELFYMFPKASYPLKPQFLIQESASRFYPTVVLHNKAIAGYGNFIQAQSGDFCSMGNIIINPKLRRTGIASYLINTLENIAFNFVDAQCIKVSCFNENTKGLLLYHKLGYLPYETEIRQSHSGNEVILIHMVKHAD